MFCVSGIRLNDGRNLYTQVKHRDIVILFIFYSSFVAFYANSTSILSNAVMVASLFTARITRPYLISQNSTYM